MSITYQELSNKFIEMASKKKIPLTGQFELTARCNLQCKMCYLRRCSNDEEALEQEHTADEWIDLAKKARESGMLYLLFTGGEIFLRKDFKYIYEEISKMGFLIEIFTNATLITPEIAKWLGKNPPSNVDVTLYGGSPETYLKVCGWEKGYNYAIQGIDLLLRENINVSIKTTVIKENVNDYEKIAEFCKERGLKKPSIVNYISPRRDRGNNIPEDARLSPEELCKFERKVNKYFMENNLKTTESALNKSLEPKFYDKDFSINCTSPFKCSAGNCAFWITWDGRMTPCSLMDYPITYPFQEGFDVSWRKLTELCLEIPMCKECSECIVKEYCLSCPARLKNETGYFDKPAPYLCELAHERKNMTEY